MSEAKYIIEGPSDGKWVRSGFYPAEYTLAEAEDIVNGNEWGIKSYRYLCVSGTPTTLRKPYRRHAAVTPLELRGAIAMLKSACRYLAARSEFDAWEVPYGAQHLCLRHLEALERQ